MASSTFSLPASLLRQHAFCPRIPYYNEVMQVNPSDRLWQKQGVTLHNRQRMLDRRRNLSRYHIENATLRHDIYLQSPLLGLHGICDALLETDTAVYPIEFKLSPQRPTKGQVIQLIAYALLAEEQFQKPSPFGFVLFGDRGTTCEVLFDDAKRHKLDKVVEEIRCNLQHPLLPASAANENQCGQCEYLNFCADRE